MTKKEMMRQAAFMKNMEGLKAHVASITPRRVEGRKKPTQDPVHGGQHEEPDGDEDAEGNEPHRDDSVEEALEELEPEKEEPTELGSEEFERHFDMSGKPSDEPELETPSGTGVDRKTHGRFGEEKRLARENKPIPKKPKEAQACRGCNAPLDEGGRCDYCGMHN